MRVNIKGPRCAQLRAKELVHKEIECNQVTDLSPVADSLASAWHALLLGETLSNTRRSPLPKVKSMSGAVPAPQ